MDSPSEIRELASLGDVLGSPGRYPWDGSLFLPRDEVWTLQSKCAVIRDEITIYESDEHPFANEQGLSLALGVASVQDIVENAKQQLPEANPEQLLSAFLYYYDNDAFIEFASTDEGA